MFCSIKTYDFLNKTSKLDLSNLKIVCLLLVVLNNYLLNKAYAFKLKYLPMERIVLTVASCIV